MSSAVMDISIDQLRALPLEKRLEIIEALWESVDDEVQQADIPDDIYEVSLRETAAHNADPSTSIPWETVYARLRAKHG